MFGILIQHKFKGDIMESDSYYEELYVVSYAFASICRWYFVIKEACHEYGEAKGSPPDLQDWKYC